MHRNGNGFLLLGLLLQEARGYHLGEVNTEEASALLDEIRKGVSTIDSSGSQEQAASVLAASRSLSVAESLVRQRNPPQAVGVTMLVLVHLLRGAALLQQL